MLLKIFYTSHLYVQAFKVKRWKNAETSKENKCLSEVFTNHRGSSPEILEFSCSEKFKNILRKTSMVVYFELILAKKNSVTDVCFWDYLGRPSWWFSVLQMESLETVRIAALKNNPWWCTFLILANKVLHDDIFRVILPNILEQLF